MVVQKAKNSGYGILTTESLSLKKEKLKAKKTIEDFLSYPLVQKYKDGIFAKLEACKNITQVAQIMKTVRENYMI